MPYRHVVYINCEICIHVYIIAQLYRCVKYIIYAFHFNTKIEVVDDFRLFFHLFVFLNLVVFIYFTFMCSETWLAHLA